MKDEREIIIVGAGPSGAITAALLAQLGHDVLLLDKQKFPRHKVCGDAVSSKAIKILHDAGMKINVEAAISRGEFYPITQMRLVSPKGYQLSYSLNKSENGLNSYIAPRIYFDTLIQQHAIEAGAEFLQIKVEEPLMENGIIAGVKVQSNGSLKNIHARIIVGADGANSTIASALRIKGKQTDKHRALALRAYIEGIEINPHEVELYLFRNILPGYAWIFPRSNDQANIGLGMRLDHYHKTPRNLKRMLNDFLAMPFISQRLKNGGNIRDLAAWPLNFGSQNNLQYVFNGALLVGDAAGFVNPLTGGGIHNSLISAQLAGQTIHRALQKGDRSAAGLQQYEKLCNNIILRNLRCSYNLQKILFRCPGLVDFYVKYLQGDSSLKKTLATKI